MNNMTEKRKAQLDLIMREYYYEKNDIESTIDFLSHMYFQYKALVKEK